MPTYLEKKPPPASLSAERSVLGSSIISEPVLFQAVETLESRDFYSTANRIIFEHLVILVNKGIPVDIITLTDALVKSKKLEQCGAEAYIAELQENVATTTNIQHHADILIKHKQARRYIKFANYILMNAYDPETEISDLTNATETALSSISGIGEGKGKTEPLSSIVSPTMDEIEAIHQAKGLTGIDTGLTGLNKRTGGLQKTDLIIIAGRPGSGKTSLALKIAMCCGVPTLLFSFEMAKNQLAQLLLCKTGQVNILKLRTGIMNNEEYMRIATAAGQINELPIYINDTTSLSTSQIRAEIRSNISRYGIKLVILDYLQLMGKGKENRNQELGEITRSCKLIAKAFNVPFVLLSQLSRENVRGQKVRRPRLSDLRDSGAIENDADMVLFTFRPEQHNPTDENKGLGEIIIGKQRMGPIGDFECEFISKYALWYDKSDDSDVPDWDDNAIGQPGPSQE